MNHDPNSGIDKSDYTRDNRAEAPTPAAPPVPPPPPYYGGYHGYPVIKKPSRFILFILACIPGLGHMYMGLIRRGLFYLSATAFTIFMTVVAGMNFWILTPLTSFAILAVYAVAFFESLSIRRDFVMGKEVVDRLPAFVAGKGFVPIIALAALAVFAIGFLASLTWQGWIIIILIAVLCAVLFSRKKTK
ncbi:MAG: hypothetical protein FWE33_00275 [Defluviitaleaceae bacterium]|nr:hypothetical protein [Defluviitaleaceae bacterium]